MGLELFPIKFRKSEFLSFFPNFARLFAAILLLCVSTLAFSHIHNLKPVGAEQTYGPLSYGLHHSGDEHCSICDLKVALSSLSVTSPIAVPIEFLNDNELASDALRLFVDSSVRDLRSRDPPYFLDSLESLGA